MKIHGVLIRKTNFEKENVQSYDIIYNYVNRLILNNKKKNLVKDTLKKYSNADTYIHFGNY